MTRHRCSIAAIMAMATAAMKFHTMAAGVTLVENGQPRATIVLAERPTRAAQMAAAELQHHIKLITGAETPIEVPGSRVQGSGGERTTRILVGESGATRALELKNDDLKSQEYLMAFRPDTVVLMGRDKPDYGELDYLCNSAAIGTTAGMPDFFDEQGTLYAAYDFLERFCGVRWYLPTELGTAFEARRTLRVKGRDVRRAPAMQYRYVHMGYRFPLDLKGDTIAGKAPIPALSAREHRLFYLRHRIGGEPYQANHSFYGWHGRFWDEKSPHFEAKRPDFFAQGYDFIMTYNFSFRPPFDGQWEASRSAVLPDGDKTAVLTFRDADEALRKSGGSALTDAQRSQGWFAIRDRETGLGLAVCFDPSSAGKATWSLRRSWSKEGESGWANMPADLLVEAYKADVQKLNTLENTFTVWALAGEKAEDIRGIHASLAQPPAVRLDGAKVEKREPAGTAPWQADDTVERFVFGVQPGAGRDGDVRPVTLPAAAILEKTGLERIATDSLRLFRDGGELAVQAAETEPERLFAGAADDGRLAARHRIVFLDTSAPDAAARYSLYYSDQAASRDGAPPGALTAEEVPGAAFKRYDYRLRNSRIEVDIRCADAADEARVKAGQATYTGLREGSIVGLRVDGRQLVDPYTPLLTTWFQQHDHHWQDARMVAGPVSATVVAHRKLSGVHRHGKGTWSVTWDDYVDIEADLYRSFTVFDRLPLVLITDRFVNAKVTPRVESGTQLCYSNPEVIAQVAQDARDFFDGKGLKHGSLGMGDHFAVVPMDRKMWCRCDQCQRWMLDEPTLGKGQFSNNAASDYVFQFASAIAREVSKTHPDKFISTLGYWEYCHPPANVTLEPNINVSLCLNSRAWGHAPVSRRNDIHILDSWRGRPEKPDLYLWLYYCFPSLPATQQKYRMFPAFFAPDIVEQMKIFHQAGVKGLKYEPSYLANGRQSPLLDQLEFYVTWKLADNPGLDGKALIDEFFTRYYGPAAKPMRAFYMRCAEIWRDTERPAGVAGPELSWSHLGTPERMEELGGFMAEALRRAEAKGTETEQRRVALFNEGIWAFMRKGFDAWHQAN
ncbi:MAG: DUF4838 domain-containing protein [Kiritimatiellae bacterium]|nr:DUF4838 domain-containing protein [Kiritimatiellia bacterium]